MSFHYLDTTPDAVSSSGRNTAATSSDWSGWASHSETMLRNTAGGARSTKVTNAGLEHLKGLANLRALYLPGTDVTDEGVKKLRQTLPHCWITRDAL